MTFGDAGWDRSRAASRVQSSWLKVRGVGSGERLLGFGFWGFGVGIQG